VNTSLISYFLLTDGRTCLIERIKLSHLPANFVSRHDLINLHNSNGLHIIFHFNPHLAVSSFRNWQSDSHKIPNHLQRPKLPCHILINASLYFFVKLRLYRHSILYTFVTFSLVLHDLPVRPDLLPRIKNYELRKYQ